MTAGQRAMATAMLYPEPPSLKGGRGKKDAAINSAETAGFSATRLKQARAVLRYSKPLADAVLAGTTPLDAAYDEIRKGERKQGDALIKKAKGLGQSL